MEGPEIVSEMSGYCFPKINKQKEIPQHCTIALLYEPPTATIDNATLKIYSN